MTIGEDLYQAQFSEIEDFIYSLVIDVDVAYNALL